MTGYESPSHAGARSILRVLKRRRSALLTSRRRIRVCPAEGHPRGAGHRITEVPERPLRASQSWRAGRFASAPAGAEVS